MNIRGLLTLGEMAKELKCPRDEVTTLISEGKFEPKICAGEGPTRIPLESIEALIMS